MRATLPVTVLILSLLVAGSRISLAQVQAGPQVATFTSTIDGSTQPYGLYLPKNLNPKKKYPVVIMLHGASSNHRLALRRVFGKSNAKGESDAEATKYFPPWKDVDYIVASPMARGTMGYQGIPEQDVYDVLAEVERLYPVDEDRVYLTGLSMGGGGTLWIGLSRPDIWAAIAPVCPAPPRGTIDLAPNALNYPVHIAQGGADPTVSPARTRDFLQRLHLLGTKAEYVEYPGVGHNSWENAYQDEAIFQWFSQFRRNRFPERVRFVTSHYKYNSAYWVRVDGLTPGNLAAIDAKFTGRNQIEVTTSELDGFTLRLAGHPKFSPTRPVKLTIDGVKLEVRGDSVSLSKGTNGTWVAVKCETPANGKRPGAEGPLAEALARRHIYVYGTADNPSAEELQKRKGQAQNAANWFGKGDPWGHAKLASFRVLADKEVTQADLDQCDLVLFGVRENNSIIDRFSSRLPLALNPDAQGYGLVYIFPIGQHYVLVNSGLPWWTVPEGVRLPGSSNTGVSGVLKSSEVDYVLFRDSWNDVVSDGRFDRNWQLPGGVARELRTSGAVKVNASAMPTTRQRGT